MFYVVVHSSNTFTFSILYVIVVGAMKTDRKKRMLDLWDEIIEDEDEVVDE